MQTLCAQSQNNKHSMLNRGPQELYFDHLEQSIGIENMFKSEFTSVDESSQKSLGDGSKHGAINREWMMQKAGRHGHTEHKLSKVISP